MHWLLLLLMLAAPFWESKGPADWTEEELERMLTDSPWAQVVAGSGSASAIGVRIFLATAAPMEEAERQKDLRWVRKHPQKDPPVKDELAEEYRLWLEDNRATQIVLAVLVIKAKAFFDEREIHQMEEESVMRIGKKKFKMTGHFPPTPTDPYLRLAFPRQVLLTDKTVSFELYLPGVASPFREAEFKVKDMVVKGKLEM